MALRKFANGTAQIRKSFGSVKAGDFGSWYARDRDQPGVCVEEKLLMRIRLCVAAATSILAAVVCVNYGWVVLQKLPCILLFVFCLASWLAVLGSGALESLAGRAWQRFRNLLEEGLVRLYFGQLHGKSGTDRL